VARVSQILELREAVIPLMDVTADRIVIEPLLRPSPLWWMQSEETVIAILSTSAALGRCDRGCDDCHPQCGRQRMASGSPLIVMLSIVAG
jgi:hypothetical protein